MTRSLRQAVYGVWLLLWAALPATSQPSPDLETELLRLPRLGTIVYTTAHPDDESGPILTYLARGLHARVVLLCLTRGEGGQNSVGPELWEELADVRTAELKRAAAGYGVEVRFLGAEDFGYSKSVDETLHAWGEEKILGELVRQIRELRPLAVISNWSGTPRDGAAHHQAAGLLTLRAFALAGNANAFTEQFELGLQPWQPRYLLVRSRQPEGEMTFEVPVDQPSPVAGKSYQELGWEAFRNHRSQGMHLFERPRNWRHFLRVQATLEAGPGAPTRTEELTPALAALPDFFPAVTVLESWRERLAQVVELAEKGHGLAHDDKRGEAALALVQGGALLTALTREIPEEIVDREWVSARQLVEDRANDFLRVAAQLAGVNYDALTDRATITPGEQVWVGLALRTTDLTALQALGFQFDALRLEAPAGWRVEPLAADSLPPEKTTEFMVSIPENLDPRRAPSTPLKARAVLTTGSLQLELSTPVRGLSHAVTERAGLLERIDPRRLLRPNPTEQQSPSAQLETVMVTAPVTLTPEPPLRLLPASEVEMMREWCVNLEAHRPQVGELSVWFEVPESWFTPVPRPTLLERAGERTRACLPVTIPAGVPPGRYELAAVAGRSIHTYRIQRVQRYAGTEDSTYFHQAAEADVEVVDVKVLLGLRVGYIGFNDDPNPALLAQLGIAVDLLDERQLAAAKLADYDAIVVATRAYEYRDDLAEATPRLLDYVRAGGTLVVEHQARGWDPTRFAPYPAQSSSGQTLRVTDETAAVGVLTPEHSVLNFPNRITEADWDGWVQERGLYFWESWAPEYTALVEMADPGEPPLRGSLVVARYGEGTYIYCGLALFRQVRAGVPGGVRLYVNLLSQKRATAPVRETVGAE